MQGVQKHGFYQLLMVIDCSGHAMMREKTQATIGLVICIIEKLMPQLIKIYQFLLVKIYYIGKFSFSQHKSRGTTYEKKLSLIFADILGPATCISFEGFHCYVNFVDVNTNFNWVLPLRLKLEVSKAFLKFKTLVESQYGFFVKAFQSDNKLKFKKMTSLLEDFVIVHQMSCPYNHQQMGQWSTGTGT